MVEHSQKYLFCYERDFMSNFHKSKQYDLKPDIGKHPLGCSLHLYGNWLINYRAI